MLKAKDGHLRERNGRASAKKRKKGKKNKEQVCFCGVNTETQGLKGQWSR